MFEGGYLKFTLAQL